MGTSEKQKVAARKIASSGVDRIRKLCSRWLWPFVAFLITFVIFFSSIVPTQVRVKVGDIAPYDIKAPREAIDEAATERLKLERRASVSEVYESDPTVLEEMMSEFVELKQELASLKSRSSSLSSQDIVASLRPFVGDALPDADIIAAVACSTETQELSMSVAQGIVSEILRAGLKPENLLKGKEDARARIMSNKQIPDQMGRFLAAFVGKILKPNMMLNQAETERRIKEAVAAVEPVRIRRGQFIVREGEVVTAEQVALMQKLGMIGFSAAVPALIGAAITSLLFCGLVFAYAYAFYPEMISQPKSQSLITCVVGVSVIAIKALGGISGYLAPAAAGVMLASTLIDRRFGSFFACCLTLAVAVVTGFEIKYMLLTLVGGVASSLAVKKVWNRSQLFKAGAIVTVSNALVYACLGLTGALDIKDILNLKDCLFVLGNGPISAILAVGSLPIFEVAFGIITPLRLIELSNPEHPLLHRLLLEAPGTYHHSIMVGNLAETAAWAIGADSLLTRVGAYYHDIGKLKRPYLFAENQSYGMENPHDKMSPNLSSAVIISHVRDGLEFARQHNLPEVIQKFIAEHHGTTLATFFYMRAAESGSKDGRPPEEADFRYEGPRPTMKETAIVMLADSVEAATRALSKPTPDRIESVVRKIIFERLTDHQLDKSDLTLRDLDVISETFVKVLAGIFHSRVEYPERSKDSASKPQ